MTTFDFANWRAMSAAEKTAAARGILPSLPSGTAFVRLADFSSGARANSIAEFDLNGSKFNLIPGGDFQIGFEVGEWEPSDEEQESWERTAEEYGLDPSPVLHLRRVLNPLRTASIPTLLVETTPHEFGWKKIDGNDPRVRDLLKEYKGGGTVTAHRGDQVIRVTHVDGGEIVAHEQVGGSHPAIAASLAEEGFRLPTSDEWEFLCGAGATTLFRWGDHVPCDRYPTDINPAEAEWRRQWALSGGKLQAPTEPFHSDWDFHRAANAFGLMIAEDSYRSELVAESNITRGGDGGCTICGGAGFFAGWLALATAYFEEGVCTHEDDLEIDPEYMHLRRVLTLSPAR